MFYKAIAAIICFIVFGRILHIFTTRLEKNSPAESELKRTDFNRYNS